MRESSVSYEFEMNLVGFCGLYCRECDYYKNIFGNKAKDLLAEIEKSKWIKTVWKSLDAPFDADHFIEALKWVASSSGCLGCIAGAGWPDCPIRKCAKAKDVRGCFDCEDYPCDIISVEQAASQRELIEQIKARGLRGYIRARRGETRID